MSLTGFFDQFISLIKMIDWNSFLDQAKEYFNIILSTLKDNYGKN